MREPTAPVVLPHIRPRRTFPCLFRPYRRSIRQRGPVHTIPFGEIHHLTNYSRDWAIMKLELRVPFDTDIEKVRKIIKKGMVVRGGDSPTDLDSPAGKFRAHYRRPHRCDDRAFRTGR